MGTYLRWDKLRQLNDDNKRASMTGYSLESIVLLFVANEIKYELIKISY